MNKLLVTAAALAAFAAVGTAGAADLPYKAPPMAVAAPSWNWTGTYVGIEGGGGWGRTQQMDVAGVTTGSFTQSGGTFGGTSGIQIQYGSWVFGAESDFSWSNINGTVTTPVCVANSCFVNLKSYGTSRTRIGYAWDRWMIYATGGIAYGRVNAGQDSCAGGFVPADGFCGTHWQVGWTAGAGVEAWIAPGWSAKLEYLYMDLGNNYSYTPVIPVYVTKEQVSLIRAGINYHFNWGGPVVARY
jgi:outer membrane immunogenic protein